MIVTIQQLNIFIGSCVATSNNELSFHFSLPTNLRLSIGDTIEIDATAIDALQKAIHLPTGGSFNIFLKPNNIHDLRLKTQHHGDSRIPSNERLQGDNNKTNP